MKRLALAALAATMLTVPTISQAAPVVAPNAAPSGIVNVDWKPTTKRVVVKEKRNGTVVRKVVKQRDDHRYRSAHKWRHGQKYSSWKRHRPVNDYRRYGLRRPAPGQQWIRVGDDYLLVGIMSGLIAGAVAAAAN